MPARSCRANCSSIVRPARVSSIPRRCRSMKSRPSSRRLTPKILTWHGCILSIYSAIAEQLRRLERQNIPYTLTPGVPAFAAAAAALECELTVPEVAQSVVLTRVSGRASRMPEAEKLATFAKTGATLVIHLAIHAIEAVAGELTPFYGADCPAAVVVRASSPTHRILRGPLADIAAKVAAEKIERTALIMVGRALGAENFRDSALYDADYRRRFRGGAA